MPYFKSKNELSKVVNAFFSRICTDKEIGGELNKFGIIVRFIFSNPDVEVTLNFKDKPEKEEVYGSFEFGNGDLVPDVTISSSADINHEFWHGKVDVLTAIAVKKITAKGSVKGAFKLIPLIKSAAKIYPEVLKEIGYERLIIK